MPVGSIIGLNAFCRLPAKAASDEDWKTRMTVFPAAMLAAIAKRPCRKGSFDSEAITLTPTDCKQYLTDCVCLIESMKSKCSLTLQTNASISSSNCKGVIDRAMFVLSHGLTVGLVPAHTLTQVAIQLIAILADDLDKTMKLLLPPFQCAHMRSVCNIG